MGIRYKNNILFCSTKSFKLEQHLKDIGFKFHKQANVYYTKDLRKAFDLPKGMISEKIKNKLYKKLIEYTPHKGLAYFDKSYRLKSNPKLQLRQKFLQPEGLDFALSRNRCYLGFDAGLGKTIIAVSALLELTRALNPDGTYKNDCKAIYVCPPFLVDNVLREFEVWGKKIGAKAIDEIMPWENPRVVIVPDTLLEKDEVSNYINYMLDSTQKCHFVIDEAHRFKTPDSLRSIMLFGSEDKNIEAGFLNHENVGKIIYMSGTPAPNGTIDYHTILNHSAPECIDFKDRTSFGKKYCGAVFNGRGYIYTDKNNKDALDQLHKDMCYPLGPFMLRVKKEDLKGLPKRIETLVHLSPSGNTTLSKMERVLLNKYQGPDKIKKAIAAGEKLTDDNIHIATYRRLLGEQKAKIALPFIKEEIENTNEHFIIFTLHQEALKILEKGLKKYKPLVITGGMGNKKKDDISERFSNGESRIMIANLVAAGIGFNWVIANRVIVLEPYWNGSVVGQGIDRTHRVTQVKDVLAQYIVLNNSFDKELLTAHFNKNESNNIVEQGSLENESND